jgi:hypothetical protein
MSIDGLNAWKNDVITLKSGNSVEAYTKAAI